MLLLLLLPAVCLGADGPGPAWDYSAGPAGPANWHENYPKCAGARQSPVDLRPTEETVAAPLQLQGYDEFFKNMTTHAGEGHVSLTGNSVPLMSGGGLPAAYRLQQVHFHWGKGAYSKGSEHTVAGKQYPVEAHLVHYKATFDDIGQAIASGAQDSLAVLGIFLEEGDIGQAAGDVLSEALPKLEDDGVSGVDLSYIIGAADLASFYRYEGGLTTPSCDQIVLWTVLIRPVTVRFDHLAMFWNSMVLGECRPWLPCDPPFLPRCAQLPAGAATQRKVHRARIHDHHKQLHHRV
jgi:carbonic anhydrase